MAGLGRLGSGAAILDRERYGPWLTLPGRAATRTTPPVVLSNLSFHGLDKDVVGRTLGSPPDGVPDAHFGIELTTPTSPGYLWGVHLERAATGPADPLPRYWFSNAGKQTSAIAVFVDGKRLPIENLDPGPCDPTIGCRTPPDMQNWLDLRWSTTPVRLDLYAGGDAPGAFTPGQRFRVEAETSMPGWAMPNPPLPSESEWLTLPGG